ncbi:MULTISPECIES: acetyl-coenzyme A synthetase N-terminal domain-containing protein [Deinococcus]|uniref:acetyl-coenzyme A synthetase N-terminal domain-containing protein n=1 Tax=Deinococcus TaxID=1298 RepID=UPI00030F4309|nr:MULTISPECIES: acetyl-coenzyme A synthetase N-terminal domain-containing protein [Deinococcus]MCY1702979.1 hypothetical protein [Deinococcus sp. SL84]
MTDAAPKSYPTPQSVLGRLRSDPAQDLEAAAHDPDAFWLQQARRYEWTREPTEALRWERPYHRWFADGQTNITLNALDRHARGENRTRAALVWISEDEQAQIYTYGTPTTGSSGPPPA